MAHPGGGSNIDRSSEEGLGWETEPESGHTDSWSLWEHFTSNTSGAALELPTLKPQVE